MKHIHLFCLMSISTALMGSQEISGKHVIQKQKLLDVMQQSELLKNQLDNMPLNHKYFLQSMMQLHHLTQLASQQRDTMVVFDTMPIQQLRVIDTTIHAHEKWLSEKQKVMQRGLNIIHNIEQLKEKKVQREKSTAPLNNSEQFVIHYADKSKK